jgi:UDP-N-acetylenolpyruvoylglucosamine reductase
MTDFQKFTNVIGEHRFNETELAKLYIEIERVDDLINIAKQARIHNIPLYIFGTSSKIPLPEHQLDGLLLKNKCRKFEIFALSGKMIEGQMGISHKLVYAESGSILNQVVRFTIEEGLGGLEYFLGFAGTIGGAIFANAHTKKNASINDSIEKIRILNKDNEIVEVGPEYFSSQSTAELLPAEAIILSAFFRLRPEDKHLLWLKADEAASNRNNKS